MKTDIKLESADRGIRLIKELVALVNEMKESIPQIAEDTMTFRPEIALTSQMDALNSYGASLEKSIEAFQNFMQKRSTSFSEKVLNIVTLDYSEEDKAQSAMNALLASFPGFISHDAPFRHAKSGIIKDATQAIDVAVQTSSIGLFLRLLIKLKNDESPTTTWELLEKRLKEYSNYVESNPFSHFDYSLLFPKSYRFYQGSKNKTLEMASKKYNKNEEALLKDIEELTPFAYHSKDVKDEVSKKLDTVLALLEQGRVKAKELESCLNESQGSVTSKKVPFHDGEFYAELKEAGVAQWIFNRMEGKL